ncbi:hypothetical protein ABB07_08720 [Streptomyces incarnatus]|uniref:Uncharacterized protein n=1 Tax=Streptomyces incarnatus TaxID=665007 RepID=A0ABN4GCM5_9ACTN|nr:hypothetical protein [Streptomyces incarnatus]AKJ10102.1 hypothetical protein ABB07_08720 [Streptomyces incarnatus]
MLDLEERVSRVFNPDVRPLVREAHRCYASGAARAAIVLTWTAVCADLIHKAEILKEDGESDARGLVEDVERAQQPGQADAVNIMLGIERSILDIAEKLELVDRTQKMQLERLREDRHLCAHPSLRPLGELFEPTAEYARAHLAVALEAVLVHPPSQGRKILESFMVQVADPAFTFDAQYLGYAFFDRVRPSARAKVVQFAAKFALLQIDDPHVTIPPGMLADRMALCLRHFAERDAALATDCVARHADRLLKADPAVQLAALARLGDLPAFWACLPEALIAQFNARVEGIGKAERTGALPAQEAKVFALVANAEVRTTLPALEGAFTALHVSDRCRVIGQRPNAYFAAHLPGVLEEVGSFDHGQFVARTAVLPCAGVLTLDDLRAVLRAWWDNDQCWGRAMPGYLVELYAATAHLGAQRDAVWREYLEELREFTPTFNEIARGTGLVEVQAD